MAEKYQYLLQVVLESKASANLFAGHVQYAGGGSRTDAVRVDENQIELKCERVSLIDLDGVFVNYQSAIYNQMAKGISFHICAMQAIPEVKKITLTAKRGNVKIKEKIIGADELNNSVRLLSKFKANFNLKSLEIIFSESEKSSEVLKAISYLIRSKTKGDPFDRFDSLWKAYNSIYRAIGKKKTDHECQVALRSFILKHHAASQTATDMVSGMTAKELRSKLRWRALILNDYENFAKTEAFSKFILRYTDARIMEVFQEILPYRQNFLSDAGLLGKVEQHIEKNVKSAVVSDAEVTALICIKYMYFIRNKSAHGERLDRIIGLGTKETKEVKWLSDLLEALIIDLINVNHLYH
ncbi:hypothetical protein DF047_23010 [Burkholderia cenocepacia]|uniref:hypothetical protein n=1 Tax=Burkholderia cenocepacia TaxID=95486 RepID=UPI000F5C1888|nr:hypothetical protein [Burkholderia cenocepacia]RQV04763.1 hypothetical protein DF047_23010 [Burkholderia cenocepacia]